MSKLALWAELEARPGKESEVEAFLTSALPLATAEPATNAWFAVRLTGSRFAIFDTFDDEQGREAHLHGQIAQALMARADELFAQPPAIHKIDVLAEKAPRA